MHASLPLAKSCRTRSVVRPRRRAHWAGVNSKGGVSSVTLHLLSKALGGARFPRGGVPHVAVSVPYACSPMLELVHRHRCIPSGASGAALYCPNTRGFSVPTTVPMPVQWAANGRIRGRVRDALPEGMTVGERARQVSHTTSKLLAGRVCRALGGFDSHMPPLHLPRAYLGLARSAF